MPPIICIAGKSGSGKTTIVQKSILSLKNRGYRVGVIKHAPCGFDMDTEGKDSFKHREAGADTVIVAGSDKIAMIKSVEQDKIENLIRYFEDTDIIIVEGYKKADFPKIEVFRKSVHKEPACIGDKNLIAFISDDNIDADIIKFGFNDIEKIIDFIEEKVIKWKR